MIIYKKELRQSFQSLCIWTGSIAFMMFACIMLFPEMKGEMENVSSVFANMGGFTAAFGMDQLSFGELMGFYGIECGNILGIGGGFFAALAGILALSKEEKERTAEFLLTHPISRAAVIGQKLLSVLTQVIILNMFVVGVSLISALFIGESFAIKEFLLLHIAYLIMQIEIACICFCVSAFVKRGSLGIGLGISLSFYFINIICNISKQAEFLRYITPYAYAEASDIISTSELNLTLICIGIVVSSVGIAVSFFKYSKKDIEA